jgi:hypothetical protein
MLLPSLLLMIVACPPQDPPAVPAAQEAAPPAVAAETPTETPQSVRDFLTEAQSHLYDPQAAGLKSLAFDLDADLSMLELGVVGVVHVSWAAGQEAQAAFTPVEGLSLPPPLSTEMVGAQCEVQAEQLLASMLNRPIASLLDAGVLTMAGVQDGLVAVKHDNPAAAQKGVKSQLYLFDEDGLLKKTTAEIEQQGPMGKMSVKMVQTFTWKPAEGSELLVADTQTMQMDLGMLGTQSGDVRYEYLQLAGVIVPVRMASTTKLPAMAGGKELKQVAEARNLVVNGEAAPAAPRAPEGG